MKSAGWFLCCAAGLTLLAACATPPPTRADTEEVSLEQAAAIATDSLIAQTRQLPAVIAKLTQRAVVIDPMIDGSSGQQTALTQQLESLVAARLRAGQVEVLPFLSSNLATAQYLLTGTATRLSRGGSAAQAPFQIDLALIDLKTGTVQAQASARARDSGLDTLPTAYYRDSPVLVKDKVVDGYIRSAAANPGTAADADYFQRVVAGAQISEATQAYNAERYSQALDLYRAALTAPAGEQLRALNGIYLASWKLGRTAEAEQAFGRVVAHGIANKHLGVKFLFNPNSTEFWSDPKISGPYALWLRQIARQAAAAKTCLDIVGHTSRTGSEAYNDRLSEQRALAVRHKLSAEAAELAPRTKARGMGYRENIIGTGSDDASDALDRRVEFKIQAC
jgi:outer membrane protein OmpA-like peptidoglycan-associated protein